MGGNGGFVEIFGVKSLMVDDIVRVNIFVIMGEFGIWLLDFLEIIVGIIDDLFVDLKFVLVFIIIISLDNGNVIF